MPLHSAKTTNPFTATSCSHGASAKVSGFLLDFAESSMTLQLEKCLPPLCREGDEQACPPFGTGRLLYRPKTDYRAIRG